MRLAVVTGAPGWLGTSLALTLARGARFRSIVTEPRPVRCLVQPGVDASPLMGCPGLELVPVDLRDRNAVVDACKGAEAVFHSAGIIHPRRVRELYEVNVGGTANVVDAARAAGVRRLVHISSNSAAGLNADLHRLMVETDPTRPYMSYGRSKWVAEQVVREANDGSLSTVILRPCWFYGPNQPERQTRFFRMIKRGRPIVVGDGSNLRSMSYVDNIVQAALLAESVEQAAGRTFWVTDRRPYPFLEIIQTIARVLGVRIRPLHLPAATSDAARLADRLIQGVGLYSQEIHVAGELGATIAVSIEAARTVLRYDPEVELEEGMTRSIAWCREQGRDI
jgi:nucleoside-diphosphate-sugar epimerase